MEKERYQRQMVLQKVGESGQQKLAQAHVVIIGCGGLGSVSTPYLAGAGIGKITLVDDDVIDVSNLHRQVTYSTQAAGMKKASQLRNRLLSLNPAIEVVAVTERLVKSNIAEILAEAHLVIEGTDDVVTKYLVNDYCHLQQIPMIYGAIHQYEGYTSTFVNGSSSDIHLRDIFPLPNRDVPTCSEVGVLGTTAGIIGMFQANEAIKYLLEIGTLLTGVLLTYDVLDHSQYRLKLTKNYAEDLSSVYKNDSYGMKKEKITYEITYSELIRNRDDYTLVSILDDVVHVDIDDEVIQLEIDEISIEDYEPISDKPVVFYCRTGKKSYGLVALLKHEDADYEVLSLKGGIKEYKKH